MMAFMGVRMSWDILERNTVLARLLASAWAFSAADCFSRLDMMLYTLNIIMRLATISPI